MIFATVGTQLPFPRLIQYLENISIKHNLHIVAQTAQENDPRSAIKYYNHLTPEMFDNYARECDCIVSHAGIGTIITAQKYVKPLIVMPRKAALHEHRNDHQLATVRELGSSTGIYIADSESEIEALLLRNDLSPVRNTDSKQRDRVICAIQQFIDA
ncbi:glycosyltransferase [Sphingobium yanoikuyae]|uniref:glycosyltransferase n=1 Tax=Sphingobium yanoikuyae TaxID=13690 RepID=UPI0009BE9EAB|nr:glycosyltransferase [Sphingobium yanoikuyae]